MLKPRHYLLNQEEGVNPDAFALPYTVYSIHDLEIMLDKYYRHRKQSYANFHQYGFGLRRLG